MIFPFAEFIDIHTHILPGLDDGAGNIQESIALARCYERLGIKKIIATPHFLPGTAWAPSKEKVLKSVGVLQSALKNERVDLQIEAGMEIAFHGKIEERILDNTLLPLSDSDYFLIEPEFHGEQDRLMSSLNSLLQKGKKIILAHPERAEAFQQHPEYLQSLVSQGLRVQVTAASLLGYYGELCKATASLLYQMNCFHLIASDAHDERNRPPLNVDEWQRLQGCAESGGMLITCMQSINDIFKQSDGRVRS